MKNLHTVSHSGWQYIPTNSTRAFPFLLIFVNTCYLLSFGLQPWLVMLSIFHMSVGHLYVFFGKTSIQVLCLFFNQPAHFLMLSCMSYFHILYINHLLAIPFANTLSHSICGLLCLLIVFFVMQKLFSLMQFLLFIFPFLTLAWGHISKNILLRSMSKSTQHVFL